LILLERLTKLIYSLQKKKKLIKKKGKSNVTNICLIVETKKRHDYRFKKADYTTECKERDHPRRKINSRHYDARENFSSL
jgi:hypothetical protein